jgi:beta-glucuronidase
VIPETYKDGPQMKITTFVFAVICALCVPAKPALSQSNQAAPANLITDITARDTVSLNGKWQTIVDPYESGYYDYRHQPRADGYFKNVKPKNKSELIEYDFDTSDELTVPGDWNSQRPELFFYEGTIWYKKSFDYQPKANTRAFVYFGAVNYLADVYLNGEKLGSHEGGFTPFDFEVTGKLKEKQNFLVVKVDNKRHDDGVPTSVTDWWNYGGITRPVLLVQVPETFIQDFVVQLTRGSQTEISAAVRLNGSQSNQKVHIKIPEAGIDQQLTIDANREGAVRLPAKMELWSPEHPKLYEVTIESETDSVHDLIGFRSIETRGTEILLNGKSIFLRGVCIHEEAPYRGGRAWSEDDARTLLSWAKELGCNYVRLAHYPHNEQMIRMADKLGLLVWAEVPVYWTIHWDDAATFARASQQLSEGIVRDRNRAAVILWSMANETPISPTRTEFLRKLASQARSLDSTRLITAALESHYVKDTTRMIDDPLGQYLDVLGNNEYIGWYEATPDKADRVEWKTTYEKPLVMSEFGGDAQFGFHADAETRWSEEYQENLYRHQIAMLKHIPFLRGTTPWILMDFRSPRRPLPRIQDFWNRKGLVSDQGQKKKAFFVLQNFYREVRDRQ